jgi:hypothetical protein
MTIEATPGGTGAGVGVTTGRGTGVDLTAGTGRGRRGSCAEKATGFVINPQRVNIVKSIIWLVFIFYCSSPWEDLVSPSRPNFRRRGSWRLIVRRGMRFVPAPFSILSLSYPETVGKSSRKRKIFRLCRFIGQAESSLPGSYDSGCPRHRARNLSGVVCRDYRSGAASFRASPTTNGITRDRRNVYVDL